ncbi:MAG: PilZ domain-containing protein [candidate division Zixibacteria bacterium]|nr:PilZ domain-containing protein [candidate division Zixibacteria bacterium]
MSVSRIDSAVLPQPLKLWEKIVVVVGEGADAGRYASRIEDFQGDALVITEPQFVSGHTLLRDGMPVTVQLTRDDAIYQFESRISRGGADNKGQAILSAPGDFRRVQRRLFVRIEMDTRIEYAVVTPEIDWTCWEHALAWKEAQARDLSGGGMRMETPEGVTIGALLLMRLRRLKQEGLPEYIFAVCRREIKEKNGRALGLEFVLVERLDQIASAPQAVHLPPVLAQFNHAAQNRLVVWIFNRQIILRQKGLL